MTHGDRRWWWWSVLVTAVELLVVVDFFALLEFISVLLGHLFLVVLSLFFISVFVYLVLLAGVVILLVLHHLIVLHEGALMLVRGNVLAFAGVVELVERALLERLEVEVRELNDVHGLVAQHLAGVSLQDGVEVLGQRKLFAILGSHCN
jgi:hypothetical protein